MGYFYELRTYAIFHEDNVILNEVKNLAAYQCDFLEMFRYAQHDNASPA